MFHRCANGLLVIPHTLRQVLPKKRAFYSVEFKLSVLKRIRQEELPH
jgi:hypothetical protein